MSSATTQEFDIVRGYRFGDTLANGAKVLQYDETEDPVTMLVLAHMEGSAHRWVVCYVSTLGHTYSGRYFSDICDAAECYKNRLESYNTLGRRMKRLAK